LINELVVSFRNDVLPSQEDLSTSTLIDKSFTSYLDYVSGIVGQVVIITLLISLTEDNKLKK